MILDIILILLLTFVVPGISYEVGITDTKIILCVALTIFAIYKYIYSERKKR